jgi:hypothetical protein
MAEDAEEKSCECARRERWIELSALDVSLAAKPPDSGIVLGEADPPCYGGPLFFFVCQNGTKKNW